MNIMRLKYTSRELYEWQMSQISQIYFQTYKLTYDWAKKAKNAPVLSWVLHTIRPL